MADRKDGAMRCRHYGTWLIAGGTYEWCYECGAFRAMREVGIAQVTPMSEWCRPVGIGKPNPWAAWNVRREAYQKRRATKARVSHGS